MISSRTILACTVLIAGFLVIGCSNGEATSNDASGVAGTKGADAGQQAATPNNPTVVNQPPTAANPGASYRITPANPNDPKFRQDPRLGGGG